MLSTNPYDKYKNNSINTATKEELTLMLYDGAVKFCNQAIVAVEGKDFIKANEAIRKVQNIVREFQITLDKKHEIANQLDQLYEYIHSRLIHANIKKDLEALTEVRDHLRSLRDTWKEAMLLAKQAPAPNPAAKPASAKPAAAKPAPANPAAAKPTPKPAAPAKPAPNTKTGTS